jgi:hypothetical protein
MAYVREYRLKNGTRRFAARYLGPDGRYHEEKGHLTRRQAEKIANKREVDAVRGDWASPAAGRITFSSYVEESYWPTTAHLEVSTRAAYRYYLDKHFLPRFGNLPMRRIGPPLIQSWINDATTAGLSAASAVKYHALLHKIFGRAVIDHVIAANPCNHTALPKVIKSPKRIITVEEFDTILTEIPARYRLLVLLAIEPGCAGVNSSRSAPPTSTSPLASSLSAVCWSRSRARIPPPDSACSSRTTRKTTSNDSSPSTPPPA